MFFQLCRYFSLLREEQKRNTRQSSPNRKCRTLYNRTEFALLLLSHLVIYFHNLYFSASPPSHCSSSPRLPSLHLWNTLSGVIGAILRVRMEKKRKKRRQKKGKERKRMEEGNGW